jgi:MFS family permease
VAVAETVLGEGDDSRQAVEAIGFEAGQPPTAAPALQAARREVQGVSQFFEGETGSLHQLLDHCRREAGSDSFAKIALVVEGASQNGSAAEFFHHRAQFVYHLSSMIATNVAFVNGSWYRAVSAQPRAIFARPVTSAKLQPRTALIVLTALNLLNYADRNVLFAVQPLVQDEFHLTKTQIGYLTSAFLGFYMVAAPFVGPLADRYSRKFIIVLGAIFWSGLTLLTAFTHNYTELLIRHTLVGIGEATFVTIAPTFVADLFAEKKRGRILGVFYLAIPVGSAAGYLLGGYLAPQHGWRFPFYIAAAPGFLLAIAVMFLREPERGQFDSLQGTPERTTVFGLVRNPAFLTSTLGMAAMTFSLGGIQVWMPQFLYSERHYTLEAANLTFGLIIVGDGIVAALAGGWLGDYLLRRMKSSYYLVSAASMALGVPVMIVALFVKGRAMIPAIALAAFFLLLNTAPLNAAVINSVDAHIRATALAVNIFIIHILGDVPSPTMMGWVADRRSLQAAFILPVIAMVISSVILFYGMKFAPAVSGAALEAGKT